MRKFMNAVLLEDITNPNVDEDFGGGDMKPFGTSDLLTDSKEIEFVIIAGMGEDDAVQEILADFPKVDVISQSEATKIMKPIFRCKGIQGDYKAITRKMKMAGLTASSRIA